MYYYDSYCGQKKVNSGEPRNPVSVYVLSLVLATRESTKEKVKAYGKNSWKFLRSTKTNNMQWILTHQRNFIFVS